MLRIYICPKCFNFRLVSRKPSAVCFHCGTKLENSDLEYKTYMNMTEIERKEYKQNYINRIKLYQEKLETLTKLKQTDR